MKLSKIQTTRTFPSLSKIGGRNNFLAKIGKGQKLLFVAFRYLLNPVDFNGSVLRELRAAYNTNEIGFFITLSFFASVAWVFMTHRRSSLQQQRKRFLY